MKRLIAGFVYIGLLLVIPAHADIQKCKKPDGSFYYTDKLCPSDAKLEESIKNKSVSVASEEPEVVDFGEGVYQQFSKAQSIVKMAAVEGRNCEWSLTVKGHGLDCVKFIKMIVEGGPYTQAMKKVVALADEDKNKDISASEYNEVLADAKKVVKYKNYMMTSLGTN